MTDGAEADAVSLRVEVLGYELGEQQGTGFGVLGRLRCKKTIVNKGKSIMAMTCFLLTLITNGHPAAMAPVMGPSTRNQG